MAVQVAGLGYAVEGREILSDIDLSVAEGDFLAILGPNGGGKTTLLRLMLGLIRPSRGEVRLFGHPPARARGRVGYVPQSGARAHLPATVRDVVLMGLRGRIGPAERDRADAALADVELAGLEQRMFGSLSGGQQQRALIARALVHQPELLLLDEPTANIDPQGRFCFYEFLAKLSKGATVIVVSHDLSILGAGLTCVACVNRSLLYTCGGQLTPAMMELLFGVHGHTCPAADSMRVLAGLADLRPPRKDAGANAGAGDGVGGRP